LLKTAGVKPQNWYWLLIPGLALLSAGLFPSMSVAQSELPRFGAGVKASTLGIGIEGATAVTKRSNVRFGFNFFDYDETKRKDGVSYTAAANFRSLELKYDQYLFSGFHVSPGILLYNGNKVNATASVPAGQSFSLGNARYFSNQNSPIGGTGTLKAGKNGAPMILVGMGNLLPRNERHFGMNFEAGVAFQGAPQTTLSLTGTACAISPTAGCVNAATDPTVQSNVRSEQDKINDDLKMLKYYPVVSLGLSWRF